MPNSLAGLISALADDRCFLQIMLCDYSQRVFHTTKMIDARRNNGYTVNYEMQFYSAKQSRELISPLEKTMNNIPFVKAADVAGEYREPPRVSKLLLAPKLCDLKNVSMGMNITEVGSMIPDHVHENSEEVLFLISGRAKIVIEGEGEWEIGPETAFYSPLGKKHRVENIGNEPLKIVWVYCPPLPTHCG